jgi:UDPglucose 6-dehydrogenase
LIIVEKSTVPVKTNDYIRALLKDKDVCVLSNPEFLAEGTAILNLLNPDRVIIGGPLEESKLLASIYENWVPKEKIIYTNIYSAELSKIVANSFLA